MEDIEFEAMNDARDIMRLIESDCCKPNTIKKFELEFKEKYGKDWKSYLSNSEDY